MIIIMKDVTLPWITLGDLTGDIGHLLSILGEIFRKAFLGLEHNNLNGEIFTAEAFLGRFTFRILALFLPFILIVTFNSLAMLKLSIVIIFHGIKTGKMKAPNRAEYTRNMLASDKGCKRKNLE